MAQTSIIQEGVDRVRDAFGSIEEEIERVQKDLRARRKKMERRFASQRRDLERRAKKFRTELEKSPAGKRLASQRKQLEKRAKKLRTEVENSPAGKRFSKARKSAARQLEQGVSDVLGTFQIASKNDVRRIDRKISQLNRKLQEMDGPKRRNGRARPTA